MIKFDIMDIQQLEKAVARLPHVKCYQTKMQNGQVKYNVCKEQTTHSFTNFNRYRQELERIAENIKYRPKTLPPIKNRFQNEQILCQLFGKIQPSYIHFTDNVIASTYSCEEALRLGRYAYFLSEDVSEPHFNNTCLVFPDIRIYFQTHAQAKDFQQKMEKRKKELKETIKSLETFEIQMSIIYKFEVGEEVNFTFYKDTGLQIINVRIGTECIGRTDTKIISLTKSNPNYKIRVQNIIKNRLICEFEPIEAKPRVPIELKDNPSLIIPSSQEDTQAEQSELPNSQETQAEQSELPKSQETQAEQSKLPNSQETQAKQSELPNSQETQVEQSELPNFQETQAKHSELPNSQETQAKQSEQSKFKRPKISKIENKKNLDTEKIEKFYLQHNSTVESEDIMICYYLCHHNELPIKRKLPGFFKGVKKLEKIDKKVDKKTQSKDSQNKHILNLYYRKEAKKLYFSSQKEIESDRVLKMQIIVPEGIALMYYLYLATEKFNKNTMIGPFSKEELEDYCEKNKIKYSGENKTHKRQKVEVWAPSFPGAQTLRQ